MTGARPRRRRVEQWLGDAGKILGLVGTALKLAQLAPAAAGVAVVAFSPNAWLSDTLRQWALGGIVAGSVGGLLTLAAAGGRLGQGGRVGTRLLVAAFLTAAALRLHLAVVDLAFVGRWPVLLPLHDAFLGTDLGERLFNLGAAAGFGLSVFLATLGLPSYLRSRGGRVGVPAPPHAAPDPAPLQAALATLSEGVASWQRAHEQLREENRRLRARLAALEAAPTTDAPPAATTEQDADAALAADAVPGSNPSA